jgi:hypothetical protein
VNPDSILYRFHQNPGQLIRTLPKGSKHRPPPPQPTDSESMPEPEEKVDLVTKKEPGIRITKLDCQSFAPLVDTVLIHYEITGDVSEAKSVHLRIASQKKEEFFILEKDLDGTPQAKGIFMWDGSVTDADYQGCVNLAGSPYWVQLGMAGKSGPPKYTNQAAIKVELMQTELTIGDGFGLGEDEKNMDIVTAVRDQVKKTPGKGIIHMPGSFFKINGDEMTNGASFTVYGDRLKKGTPIPLFVKLWLKGKDGSKKRSPKAVANTRILWDAMPEDETGLDANLADRGINDSAKRFMKKVFLYKKDDTEPPGATSQWEIGGIRCDVRARKAGRQQFEDLADEWKTEPPAERIWAGFSKCAKLDTSLADSGMMYYNGRIAGDRYHVAAYADIDANLDDKDPKLKDIVSAPRKAQPLALQNWRDVGLAKGYVIGAGTAPLDFGEANKEFKKGALSIVPNPGMVPEEIQERWKSEYRDALIILSGISFYKDAAKTDPGFYPAAFIDYDDYWAKTNTDAGFFGRLWNRIKGVLGVGVPDDYIKKCDNAAYNLYTETAKAFPLGENGLTYFKFRQQGEHNLRAGTIGIAPDIRGYTKRNQAVLFVFDDGQAVNTVLHEMGHNLFLPHAPGHWEAGKQPAGSTPTMHDSVQTCLMSYHPGAKYFCGLCFLRLGGLDHSLIDSQAEVFDVFEPA